MKYDRYQDEQRGHQDIVKTLRAAIRTENSVPLTSPRSLRYCWTISADKVDEERKMSRSSKNRFQGILLSIPTFADQDHNLLLNRLRIHFNWLIDNGMTEGNAILMVAGGMGEGSASKMIFKAIGIDSGPPFPAQIEQPQKVYEAYRRYVESSSLLDWVDWDQSIFDGV
jgi:hypothetical protein